ncbi:hypothetical protein [Maridesulfovibrio ferrireducens]|uniref:hypothetical protein n=1 Tax=Maridesulfovibrio ferrireducens TaxID=246191 RepID=UPI001A25CFD8|nr:hypothetical protein [Maridesulfovibrio ferrireducens]MBI9113059.1 hypothetical protein [Maridesulfovibrio ferrireducens]
MTIAITIMLDWGGAWAWERDLNENSGVGPNIASDTWWSGPVDIPEKLVADFCAWQRKFEVQNIPEFDLNCEEFHEDGLNLCKQLRPHLPSEIRLFFEFCDEVASEEDWNPENSVWLYEIMPDTLIRPIVVVEEMKRLRPSMFR